MLRLLQSIFGHGETTGGFPETIVRKAIERAVDGTDPWLRSVPGYRKKLRPSVLRAIEHVVALVDGLPPPVTMSSESYRDDPRVKAFFISMTEMREIFGKDRNLADYLRRSEAASRPVTALLFMEKKENRILGVEMSGDTVMRDVPQVTVSFESHLLMDPAEKEEETRLLLKRRAFDYLIRVALQRISAAKSDRKDLERRNALLKAKLDVLRRGGWGFAEDESSPEYTVSELEENLRRIEAQLAALGSDDRMLGSYLDIVIDVLGQPAEHLRGEQEILIVDRMGIKREQVSSNTLELTITTLLDTAGRCRVAQLVSLPGEELSSRGN
jgi:hypothetical protein